jgi:hypothetical protein
MTSLCGDRRERDKLDGIELDLSRLTRRRSCAQRSSVRERTISQPPCAAIRASAVVKDSNPPFDCSARPASSGARTDRRAARRCRSNRGSLRIASQPQARLPASRTAVGVDARRWRDSLSTAGPKREYGFASTRTGRYSSNAPRAPASKSCLPVTSRTVRLERRRPPFTSRTCP